MTRANEWLAWFGKCGIVRLNMKILRLPLLALLLLLPAMRAHAQTPVVHPNAQSHAQHPAAKPTPPKLPAKPAPATPPAVTPPAPSPPAAVEEQPAPPATVGQGSVTHQPLPYFMTFRFDDVNLRVGPGTNYPIEWVYHRRDLPVEVLLELGDWRKIRDQDNIIGWVRAPSMWKRRSVVVRGALRTLRSQAAESAPPVALLKPGVVAHVHACPAGKSWCDVEINAYRGWIKRDEIYGVYPDEALEGQ